MMMNPYIVMGIIPVGGLLLASPVFISDRLEWRRCRHNKSK